MKIIAITILISLNSFAQFKTELSSSPDNSNKDYFITDTELEAKDRLKKISKLKNGWRKGSFDLAEQDSIYSEVFEECDENNSCSDVTKYYHPLNWTFSITDVSAEEQEKKDKKQENDDLINKLKSEDLKLDEINKLLRSLF